MELHNCCSSCENKYCAKKISLFSSLSDKELNKITNLIVRKTFNKGDIIFSENDVSDKLFIINKGSIKVYKYNKDGKEQILYILKEGDFLGDLNLLKKDNLKFNSIALEFTSLCILHKDDFDALIKINSDISIKVLEYAHDRILSLENLIQTLTTKDVEVRLASLLLSLAKSFGVNSHKGIEVSTHLSREEMANFIGVTRETVSRKLSVFQNEDIIDILENKSILIKDIDTLKKLSEI